MGNRKWVVKFYSLVVIVIFYASALSLAADRRVIRTQGMINSGTNVRSGFLLVNEMRVYLDNTTRVMDHRELPMSVTEMKPKRWVYMELEKDPIQKVLKARKIYLLPHYVKPKERQKFSFMK